MTNLFKIILGLKDDVAKHVKKEPVAEHVKNRLSNTERKSGNDYLIQGGIRRLEGRYFFDSSSTEWLGSIYQVKSFLKKEDAFLVRLLCPYNMFVTRSVDAVRSSFEATRREAGTAENIFREKEKELDKRLGII